MIDQIGKITLYVKDQAEAKKFWTEKAGFTVKLEQPMGPGMTWLEVGPSKESFTTFVLYSKETMAMQNPKTNLGHPSVLLSTSDIDKTYSDLKSKGVETGNLMNMPYGRMFNFKDQDGNDFIVREDK